MNKMLPFFVMFVTGCATTGTTNQSKVSADTNRQTSCNETCPVPQHNKPELAKTESQTDSKSVAVSAGEIIGKGARMTWDAGKNTWVYVSSDEAKEKASDMWKTTKKTVLDLKASVTDGFKQGDK